MANSSEPDEMQYKAAFHSGFALFAQEIHNNVDIRPQNGVTILIIATMPEKIYQNEKL